MKFLNKKERVLDVQLTQYGKAMLSVGDFEPHYYAFFDDDVTYDSNYGGVNEGQNESEPRIKEDLQMQAPYVFKSVEPTSRPTPTIWYNDAFTLGNADLGTKNNAAWSINALKGAILSSTSYYTGSLGVTSSIVQLNFSPITYRSEVNFGDPNETEITESYTSVPFSDDTYLRVFEDSIVLEINENNTPFESENFEVEVFRVEKDYSNAGQEILHRLDFVQDPIEIKDNILLDTPEGQDQPLPLMRSDVSYWFDILIDNEIGEKTLCDLYPEDKADGVFNSRMLSCEKITKEEKVNNRNLYSSDVSISDLDEDC